MRAILYGWVSYCSKCSQTHSYYSNLKNKYGLLSVIWLRLAT